MGALDDGSSAPGSDSDGQALAATRHPRSSGPGGGARVKRIKAAFLGDLTHTREQVTDSGAKGACRFKTKAQELATLSKDSCIILTPLGLFRPNRGDHGDICGPAV